MALPTENPSSASWRPNIIGWKRPLFQTCHCRHDNTSWPLIGLERFYKSEAINPFCENTLNSTIKKFASNPEVASAFASEFVALVNDLAAEQSKITVALSGGSTPKLLFSILAEQYADQAPWSKVHFFWGDERCVAPSNAESNYGEANKLFLSPIGIPAANVHRVLGESDPSEEAVRYGQEIADHVVGESGVPAFDILMLGMGSDGHTASIFPHEIELLKSTKICEVATHPESGQKRITVTGKVLNAATNVFFLITGEAKANVLAEIINRQGAFETYPTSFVNPAGGCNFFIDESAGSLL